MICYMERECSVNHLVSVKLLKLSRLPLGNGNVVISKSADARLYRSRSLDQQPPQLTIFYTERLTDSTDLRDGYDPSMHGRHGMISYLFCVNLVDLLPKHEFLSFASKRLPELSRCL